MHFQILACLVFVLNTHASTNSAGRKPAVEDFVGIEVEHAAEVTPQGTDGLFNFEKAINSYELKEQNQTTVIKSSSPIWRTSQTSWDSTTWVGLGIVLSLPILSWLVVMSHLRRKASMESASNIEVLEKYRKEREEGKRSEKIKKAS